MYSLRAFSGLMKEFGMLTGLKNHRNMRERDE
jgi:hypothetical protein